MVEIGARRRGDMGEMWGRCGGDMGEIWARDGRDIGEIWAGLVWLAHAAKRRRAPHLLSVVRVGLGLGLG